MRGARLVAAAIAAASLASACGSAAHPVDERVSTSTTVASSTTVVVSTTSVDAPTTTPPSPISTAELRVPKGRVAVRAGDVFVVGEDGDVWILSGLTSDAPSQSRRLLDLADPRVKNAEGPGADEVDAIVGPIDGVVFFTDCCEPAAGNLRAVTESGGERLDLAPGGRVTRRPDGRTLATVNRYALAVIDLDAGRSTTRSFSDAAAQPAGEIDVIWSPDGTSLIVLDAGAERLRLVRFVGVAPMDVAASQDISLAPRTSSSWVRFAGRGPNGEIVVAVRDTDATRFRAFDPRTLAEIDAGLARIDGPVSSVQLGPDGRSVLWVADGVVTFRAADGRMRSSGAGIAAAWFAGE